MIFISGAIHCHAGPVHEERAGLRARLLHHGPVNLQRPARPQRTDPESQGKPSNNKNSLKTVQLYLVGGKMSQFF